MKLLGPEGDVIDAFKYINRVFDVDNKTSFTPPSKADIATGQHLGNTVASRSMTKTYWEIRSATETETVYQTVSQPASTTQAVT